MSEKKEVPFINQSTGEVLGKAIILPPDDKERVYANIEISPDKVEIFKALTQDKHRNISAGIVVEEDK
jgi:hypothetical protein